MIQGGLPQDVEWPGELRPRCPQQLRRDPIRAWGRVWLELLAGALNVLLGEIEVGELLSGVLAGEEFGRVRQSPLGPRLHKHTAVLLAELQ